MTAWTDLVSQTFKAGKSKNAKYSLKDAMKHAKKLYKNGGKHTSAHSMGGSEKVPTVGGNEKAPTVGGSAEIPDSKASVGGSDPVPHSSSTGLQGAPLKGGKSRRRKSSKRSTRRKH